MSIVLISSDMRWKIINETVQTLWQQGFHRTNKTWSTGINNISLIIKKKIFQINSLSLSFPLSLNELKSVSPVSCVLLFANPVDWSLPGSSVHGILQARIPEWVAIPFSRRSFWVRDQTQISCIAGRFFTIWATREAQLPGKPNFIVLCEYTTICVSIQLLTDIWIASSFAIMNKIAVNISL